MEKTGQQLRDEGARRVDSVVDPEWVRRADEAMEDLANTLSDFTAEDLRARVGVPPGHPNAIGSRFLAASKRGLIRKTGAERTPSRKSRHANANKVWTKA